MTAPRRRVLLLGATGYTGQWVVRLGAERFAFTALVREHTGPIDGSARIAKLNAALRRREINRLTTVTVALGEATDPATLDRVMPGHDAVLCCLGQKRAGKGAWAKPLSPPDLMQQVMRGLVPAMERHGVSRLVVLSAAGVGDSRAQVRWPVTVLIRAGQVGVAYADLERMEQQLAASRLDWLAVRPVALIHGEPTAAGAGPVESFRLFALVRRADVAQWMLDALDRPAPFAPRAVLLGQYF